MSCLSVSETLIFPLRAASIQPRTRCDGTVSEYIEDLSPRKSGTASVPFRPPYAMSSMMARFARPARCILSTRFPSSSVPSTAATGCEPSAQRSPFAFSVSSALVPSTFRLKSSEPQARRNAGTWLGRVVIVRFSAPSTALRATPPMRCELRGIEIV